MATYNTPRIQQLNACLRVNDTNFGTSIRHSPFSINPRVILQYGENQPTGFVINFEIELHQGKEHNPNRIPKQVIKFFVPAYAILADSFRFKAIEKYNDIDAIFAKDSDLNQKDHEWFFELYALTFTAFRFDVLGEDLEFVLPLKNQALAAQLMQFRHMGRTASQGQPLKFFCMIRDVGLRSLATEFSSFRRSVYQDSIIPSRIHCANNESANMNPFPGMHKLRKSISSAVINCNASTSKLQPRRVKPESSIEEIPENTIPKSLLSPDKEINQEKSSSYRQALSTAMNQSQSRPFKCRPGMWDHLRKQVSRGVQSTSEAEGNAPLLPTVSHEKALAAYSAVSSQSSNLSFAKQAAEGHRAQESHAKSHRTTSVTDTSTSVRSGSEMWPRSSSKASSSIESRLDDQQTSRPRRPSDGRSVQSQTSVRPLRLSKSTVNPASAYQELETTSKTSFLPAPLRHAPPYSDPLACTPLFHLTSPIEVSSNGSSTRQHVDPYQIASYSSEDELIMPKQANILESSQLPGVPLPPGLVRAQPPDPNFATDHYMVTPVGHHPSNPSVPIYGPPFIVEHPFPAFISAFHEDSASGDKVATGFPHSQSNLVAAVASLLN